MADAPFDGVRLAVPEDGCGLELDEPPPPSPPPRFGSVGGGASTHEDGERWQELPEETDVESSNGDETEDDDLWQCDTKGSLVLEVEGVEECRRTLHDTFGEQLKIWF